MMEGVGKSSPWQMVALVSVILQEMVLGKDHAALLKGFVATQRSTASVGHVLTTARYQVTTITATLLHLSYHRDLETRARDQGDLQAGADHGQGDCADT